MLQPAYLVIQPRQGRVTSYRSQQEAWEAASCLTKKGDGWIVESRDDRELAMNPAAATAELAMKLSRLPRLSTDEVMRIPPEHAWRSVRPYFPNTRDYKTLGVFVGADTGRGLLRENAKLVKALKKGRKRSTQVGLQLVPEASVFKGYGAGNRQKRFESQQLPVVGQSASTMAKGPYTLCAGSSTFCRTACLQFSGQNVAPAAVSSKHMTTLALLDRPAEFMRLLVEACRNFAGHAMKATTKHKPLFPYIRLNVLSDVPWELAFPGLFEVVRGRMRTVHGQRREHLFYDYTKLVGRGAWAARNYQITFSFSGVNMPACHAELGRGTNVTVPFLHVHRDHDGSIRAMGRRGGRERKDRFGRYLMRLPKTWEGRTGLGLPVVDGDEDDLRPLDPSGVWVGLRYKAAAGITDAELVKKVGAFVVCCWEDPDTGLFVAAETPNQTNVDTGKR